MKTNVQQSMFDIVAGKWTIPVIRVLQKDTLRYSAIERSIPSITQRALTIALRKLNVTVCSIAMFTPSVPPQVEYKLTSLGLKLLELSGVLSEWSDMNEEEIKRAQKNHTIERSRPQSVRIERYVKCGEGC